MSKRWISGMLILCFLLTVVLPMAQAQETTTTTEQLHSGVVIEDIGVDVSESGNEESAENCHTMTQEWFGEKGKTRLPAIGEGKLIENVISLYFSSRESGYKDTLAKKSSVANVCSLAVRNEMEQYATAIDAFQKRSEINILDAEVTTIYDESDIVYNEDGTITVYVYEWTFFDYDDLYNDKFAVDVSGCGVYHKITLEKSGNSYVILYDEYDQSDM